jgi:hypothetical protein
MPSRAKRWFPANETDEFKTFRFEDEESGVWIEIWYDKRTGYYTRVRNHLNTPGKWSRLPEPIKNYQIVSGLP